MGLLQSRQKFKEFHPPEESEVLNRREQLSGISRVRVFQLKDALISREAMDPSFSRISFRAERSFDSTGITPSTGTQEITFGLTWESKGIQGLLNLLGTEIVLEEVVQVSEDFTQWAETLQEENQNLLRENQRLLGLLGEIKHQIP